MLKYIAKRLLAMIPVILGVTLIVYLIMSLAPGDPARTILGELATEEQVNELREEMGLNDPIIVQYFRYIWNLLHGDLGRSYQSRIDVSTEIFSRFPNTIKLALAASLFSVILALPLGIIAAVKQNTFFDSFSMFVAIIGISCPTFWFGLILILVFAVNLKWFPVSGQVDNFRGMVLPALTLAFNSMAAMARVTRSSMLEVIRQDYIRTARAKGVSQRNVILQHAVPNAMIPTVTVIGLRIGGLLAGAVICETVFSWPGIGRLLVQSIQSRNTPVVLGCIIIFSICFSLVNLIVDILYAFIDPRIKSQYQ
ncbi:MAG: ABC transporter permease [Clostridia bacterium]|nr:ABC transporter permease [Clostridia bacterium]MBR0387856.1 ABC transporter permease [Clostridia bacterium]